MSEDFVSIVRAIGSMIDQRLGSIDHFTSTRHLFSRVSVALWRGNAVLWVRRRPPDPSSVDGLV